MCKVIQSIGGAHYYFLVVFPGVKYRVVKVNGIALRELVTGRKKKERR